MTWTPLAEMHLLLREHAWEPDTTTLTGKETSCVDLDHAWMPLRIGDETVRRGGAMVRDAPEAPCLVPADELTSVDELRRYLKGDRTAAIPDDLRK